MSNKKILTIGLPVFNGEKFLRRRLENILSQTFEDFLLVISDNNSNDKTFDICMEFQRLDKRITYVKQNFNQPIPNMLTLLDNSNTKHHCAHIFPWLSGSSKQCVSWPMVT